MKKNTSILLVIFFSLTAFGLVWGQDKSEAAFIYGGVATCKACHLPAKSGAQFKLWQTSPHAKAFETLQGDAAKAIGKKMGIEDPSASEKCLKCHVTAYGVDAKLRGPKLTMEEGVSCESCHGPGSAYKGRKVMADIFAGTVDGAKFGLVEPTEKVCVTCHNEESPTYKKFVYAERVAKIAHPVPDKK